MTMSKFGKFFRRFASGGFSPASLIAALVGSDSDSLIEKLLGSNPADTVSSYLKGVSGSGLTNAEIQQNEWNAGQAAEQRAWEEQMDNTKYQRQTADMAAAGLNPAMMYGQGYSASTPSGAAASGGDAGTPSAGLIDSLLNVAFAKQRMANLRAEGDVLAAEAENKRADTESKRADVVYKRLLVKYYPDLTDSTIERIKAEANRLGAAAELDVATKGVKEAEKDLLEVQKAIADIEKEWKDKILQAETNAAKAKAVHDFAEAAWIQYQKNFAESHGGVTPGRDMWTGFAATLADSISHVVDDVKNYINELVPDWIDNPRSAPEAYKGR